MVPRRSGDSFRIAIWPHEADPGHQTFTSWRFRLAPVPFTADTWGSPPVWFATEIHVEIWAEKGVVPFEAPHADFWQGRDEIELFHNLKRSPRTPCLAPQCDYPAYESQYPTHWDVWWTPEVGATGNWVPPGADRIEGELAWTRGSAVLDPNPVEWTLAYQSADGPPERPCEGCPRVEEVDRDQDGLRFRIILSSTPEDEAKTDKFYQSRSAWTFYLDDQRPPFSDVVGWAEAGKTSSGTGTWSLTATVYRLPPQTQ